MTRVRNLGLAWLTLILLGLMATVGSLDGCSPAAAVAALDAEPQVVALPASTDPAAIVMEYVDGAREDALLQLDDFVWVKASNYRGVKINGRTYYYQLLPHASFDPLSRGTVDERAVRVWNIIGDGEFTVIIYTVEMPDVSQA